MNFTADSAIPNNLLAAPFWMGLALLFAVLAVHAEAEIELPSLDVDHSDFPPGF